MGIGEKRVKVLVIPDTQCKPGVPMEHLSWIGQYAVDKKPDVIVHLGDHADMPSLSSHDKAGSKSMEGKRYKQDISAAQIGMSMLMEPIKDEQNRLKRNKEKQWKPRLVLTLGNHEHRIERAIQNDPKLEGLISVSDLQYEKFGWEVYDFLKPVTINGVVFCHYLTSGVMGRPCTSAKALLSKHHQSCVVGHQQGRDIAYGHRADGTEMTALIAGSCYMHDENYLNYQTNNHWRGIYMLHEVNDGAFDEMAVSLQYLKEQYGQ
jgi:hypothetical protein